ncbi:MAG: glutathione S-transferase N-terminal domain-containing protein [Hyphomonadaceae bacterium]
MTKYTIYGSQASLFTGKARGYLRWKGVDFVEHAVNDQIMKEIILPKVGWPVIPVMQTEAGKIVQDTADIMAEIEANEAGPSVRPEGPVQRFVSELLHTYADQWLVVPAMHYRWNYNEDWIYGEFGRSSAPDATPEEQYALGKARGQMFRGFVPMLGINDETIPGIEASYEAFLAEFSAHLDVHPYTFGARPSLADFAFLGPLYAHLYRDPASGEIMKRLAPNVANWTERTIAGEGGDAALVGEDAIPETLEPILRRAMDEHLPVLQRSVEQFQGWLATAEAGAEVPRAFGQSEFTQGGRTGQIITASFSLFRLQAALDEYAAMDDAARTRADALLDRIGGNALKRFALPARLERRNYKLHLAQ